MVFIFFLIKFIICVSVNVSKKYSNVVINNGVKGLKDIFCIICVLNMILFILIVEIIDDFLIKVINLLFNVGKIFLIVCGIIIDCIVCL